MGQALKRSNAHFSVVVASDRGRVLETVGLLLEEAGLSDSPIEQNPDWREMCFGEYEGCSNEDTIAAILHYNGYETETCTFQSRRKFRELITDTMSKIDKSGWAESREQFEARLLAALNQVILSLEQCAGQRALVVAHGVVMETLFLLLEKTADLPEIDNGRAMILQHENGVFTVKAVNVAAF